MVGYRFLFPNQNPTARRPLSRNADTTKAGLPPVGFHSASEPAAAWPSNDNEESEAPEVKHSPAYRHYDVFVEWEEDALDTSCWSQEVRKYTRLYYARYGSDDLKSNDTFANKSCSLPVLEASVRSSMKPVMILDGTDRKTGAGSSSPPNPIGVFLTEAYVPEGSTATKTPTDINPALQQLWERYVSEEADKFDLRGLQNWAARLRPRSIHDLKPLLILCQGLLRHLLVNEVSQHDRDMQLLADQALMEQERMSREHRMLIKELESNIKALQNNTEQSVAQLKSERVMDHVRRWLENSQRNIKERKGANEWGKRLQSAKESQEQQQKKLQEANDLLAASEQQVEFTRKQLDETMEQLSRAQLRIKELEAINAARNRPVKGLSPQPSLETRATSMTAAPFNKSVAKPVSSSRRPSLEEHQSTASQQNALSVDDTIPKLFSSLDGMLLLLDPLTNTFKSTALGPRSKPWHMTSLEERAARTAVAQERIHMEGSTLYLPVQDEQEKQTAVMVLPMDGIMPTQLNSFTVHSPHSTTNRPQQLPVFTPPDRVKNKFAMIATEKLPEGEELEDIESIKKAERGASQSQRERPVDLNTSENHSASKHPSPRKKAANKPMSMGSRIPEEEEDEEEEEQDDMRSMDSLTSVSWGETARKHLLAATSGIIAQSRFQQRINKMATQDSGTSEVAKRNKSLMWLNDQPPVKTREYIRSPFGKVPLVQRVVIDPVSHTFQGVATPKGSVLRADGSVAGELDENGKMQQGGSCRGSVELAILLQDLDGNPMGYALTSSLQAYDAESGVVVGELNLEKGEVVSLSGKVIGKPVPDSWVPGITGSVKNFDGEVIGAFDDLGLVRNGSGQLIGHVCPDGSVRHINGDIIGVAPIKAGMQRSNTHKHQVACDANGNPIGVVDSEGYVRSISGKIIGEMLEDGTVVDPQGMIIGQTAEATLTGVVKNPDGEVIGIVHPDGSVHGAGGFMLGVLGEDGELIAAHPRSQENLQQSRAYNFAESSDTASIVLEPEEIHDAEGNLLGVLGVDGIFLSPDGEYLGSMAPDGTIISDSGIPIAKTDKPHAKYEEGRPGLVYSKDGTVVGVIGTDGTVRDEQGTVVAVVNSSGKVVDTSGAVIGSAVASAAFTPGKSAVALSPQGHVIGCVDASCQVIGDGGVVIGRAISDGLLVGLNAEQIGHAVAIAPAYRKGSPGVIKDHDGNVVGVIGDDGIARSLAGRELGTVAANGMVVGASGQVFGQAISVLHLTPGELGVACNEHGLVIGTIGVTGTASRTDGSFLGRVSNEGIVVNNEGVKVALAAATVPYASGNLGLVYDDNGKRMGVIDADGVALADDGTVIGSVMQDGTVLDSSGKVLGRAAAADSWQPGTAGLVIRTSVCNIPTDVNLVNEDGQVTSRDGELLGFVNKDGVAVDRDGNEFGIPISTTAVAQLEAAPAAAAAIGSKHITGKASRTVLSPNSLVGNLPAPEDILHPMRSSRGVINTDGAIEGEDKHGLGASRRQSATLESPRASSLTSKQCKRNTYTPPRASQDGVRPLSAANSRSTTAKGRPSITGRISSGGGGRRVSNGGSFTGATGPLANYSPNANDGSTRSPKAARQSRSSFTADASLDLQSTSDARPRGFVVKQSSMGKASPRISKSALEDQPTGMSGGARKTRHKADCSYELDNADAYADEDVDADEDPCTAATESVVRDSTGAVLGVLGNDGMLRSRSGEVLGTVTADGTVLDKHGKVTSSNITIRQQRKEPVGRGKPRTKAQQLPRGDRYAEFENQSVAVRNHVGEIVGTVGSDGIARSSSGTVLGQIQDDGSIIGQGGKLVGQADVAPLSRTTSEEESAQRLVEVLVEIAPATVMGDGSVQDKSGTVIGTMEIPSSEKSHGPLSMVAVMLSEGLIVSKKGKVWGRMSEDGKITDQSGKPRGSVSQETAGRLLARPMSPFAAGAPKLVVKTEMATQCDPDDLENSSDAITLPKPAEDNTEDTAMSEEELAEAEMWLQRVRSVQQRWKVLHSAVRAALTKSGASSKLTQEHIRQSHMKDMQELYTMRVQLQTRMATRDCEVYLVEMRNYRRPPRVAAMVMCAVMFLLDERQVYQWRDESLLGIKFPTHQNTISQIWMTMQLSMADLKSRLQGVRTDKSDQHTMRNCKAAELLVEQVTDDQAKRTSQVVALLRTWAMVLLEVHKATIKFEAELLKLSATIQPAMLPGLARTLSRGSTHSAPANHIRRATIDGQLNALKPPSTAPS